MSAKKKRITNWFPTIEEQIARRMWPEETQGSLYLDVWEMADKAQEAGGDANSITSIFLYQQLTEEILLLVDYFCYFEKAVALYPTHLAYSIPDKMMFGQVIERIKSSQDFPGKADILLSAKTINQDCRIPVAHGLINRSTLKSLEAKSRDCRGHFTVVMNSLNLARDHFYSRYAILAGRTGIAEIS